MERRRNVIQRWRLLLVLCLSRGCVGDGEDDGKPLACVGGYCLPAHYNRLELPGRKITHIDVNLEILDVLRVDDKKFSVTLSMYFGVFWIEDRLLLPNASLRAEWVPIDMEFMRLLWVPNAFVYHLVSFDALQCLQKLAGLWIVKDNELFYNQATHVTFMCAMRFNRFPMDEHTCKFLVGSVSYDNTRMTFGNRKLDYVPEAGNTILDYQVRISPLSAADRVVIYGDTGNYSTTGFEMTLRRNVAKYLYIYYLPSGLFVVVSWTSFLIPPEVVPGRMALLITIFLVLINILNTITNMSPNVEGTTAIAAWMIACVLFVFLALLGYAGLLYYLQFNSRRRVRTKLAALRCSHAKDCALHPSSEAMRARDDTNALHQSTVVAAVDSAMLYAFPIMFAVFNAAYWPYWMMPG